jgi:hypothetical protein
VGPRTGLDDTEKRKFLPLPGLELRPLGRPARRRRYTDCARMYGSRNMCAVSASGIVRSFFTAYLVPFKVPVERLFHLSGKCSLQDTGVACPGFILFRKICKYILLLGF